jgi:hydrogenase nickel incorporation protein HypB
LLELINMKITVLNNILEANDVIADQIRHRLDEHHVLAINLMSSPGAGKTTLLERTIEKLLERNVRAGVIEGDIETTRDGSACHLDANMTKSAVDKLDCSTIDVLFVENVGNLVCPAEFKIGEDHKVMLLSVTEGDEKPLKYPLMFRESSAMLINKIDLLQYTNFNMDEAKANAGKINPKLLIFPVSCTSGEGLDGWLDWLLQELKKKQQ